VPSQKTKNDSKRGIYKTKENEKIFFELPFQKTIET
jgi:hypothetical protein